MCILKEISSLPGPHGGSGWHGPKRRSTMFRIPNRRWSTKPCVVGLDGGSPPRIPCSWQLTWMVSPQLSEPIGRIYAIDWNEPKLHVSSFQGCSSVCHSVSRSSTSTSRTREQKRANGRWLVDAELEPWQPCDDLGWAPNWSANGLTKKVYKGNQQFCGFNNFDC